MYRKIIRYERVKKVDTLQLGCLKMPKEGNFKHKTYGWFYTLQSVVEITKENQMMKLVACVKDTQFLGAKVQAFENVTITLVSPEKQREQNYFHSNNRYMAASHALLSAGFLQAGECNGYCPFRLQSPEVCKVTVCEVMLVKVKSPHHFSCTLNECIPRGHCLTIRIFTTFCSWLQ